MKYLQQKLQKFENFYNFSILFNFISFSDRFLRYLGKTRNFFIRPVRKYEFFTVGGGLTPVGSKISLIKKFLKNSQLFFHQIEASLVVRSQIKGPSFFLAILVGLM